MYMFLCKCLLGNTAEQSSTRTTALRSQINDIMIDRLLWPGAVTWGKVGATWVDCSTDSSQA